MCVCVCVCVFVFGVKKKGGEADRIPSVPVQTPGSTAPWQTGLPGSGALDVFMVPTRTPPLRGEVQGFEMSSFSGRIPKSEERLTLAVASRSGGLSTSSHSYGAGDAQRLISRCRGFKAP